MFLCGLPLLVENVFYSCNDQFFPKDLLVLGVVCKEAAAQEAHPVA